MRYKIGDIIKVKNMYPDFWPYNPIVKVVEISLAPQYPIRAGNTEDFGLFNLDEVEPATDLEIIETKLLGTI